MKKWDWYQASMDHPPEWVLGELIRAFDLSQSSPGRPKNGYTQAANVVRGDQVLAQVYWGTNPGTHVIGTGENAPAVAEVLRALGPHRVTRADAAEDYVCPGLFDEFAVQAMEYAQRHGIKINQQGDWARGEGRTLYLGARSAPVQLVVYEKGYEVGLEFGGDPDHVRFEVRVRPAKQSRAAVAEWSPGECWGASRWLRGLMADFGLDGYASHSIGTVWRPSDAERARMALVRQYGAIIREWVDEAGSWGEWLDQIREKVEEAKDGDRVCGV